MLAQGYGSNGDESPAGSQSRFSYDAWAAAIGFIEEHGDNAELAAAECADSLITEGDAHRRRFFKEVLTAISEFQRVSPHLGEFVN